VHPIATAPSPSMSSTARLRLRGTVAGMTRLWHLAEPDDWVEAQITGFYERSTRGVSLTEVGFVHCSYPDLLPSVVSTLYADTVGEFIVLELDRQHLEKAGSPVRDEPGDPQDPASPLFPHVYGPIPVSTVTAVLHAKVDRGRLTVESPEN